jgi:hypothetical protein
MLHQPGEIEYDRANLAQPWGKQTCTTNNAKLSLLHWMQHQCMRPLRFLYKLDERGMWMQRPLMRSMDDPGISISEAYDILYRLTDVLIQHKNQPTKMDMAWAHAKAKCIEKHIERRVPDDDDRPTDWDPTFVPTYAAASKRLGGVTGIHRRDLTHALRESHDTRMTMIRCDLQNAINTVDCSLSLLASYYWGMLALGVSASRVAKRGSPVQASILDQPDDAFVAYDLMGRKSTTMVRLILDMANMNTTYLDEKKMSSWFFGKYKIGDPMSLYGKRSLLDTKFAQRESVRVVAAVAPAVVAMEDVAAAPVARALKRKVERLD